MIIVYILQWLEVCVCHVNCNLNLGRMASFLNPHLHQGLIQRHWLPWEGLSHRPRRPSLLCLE